MKENLYDILRTEEKELYSLLKVLEKQHKIILEKNVTELNLIIDEIKMINKNVAETEVKRRKITGNKKINELLQEDNDKNIDRALRDIKILLSNIKLQKDTNELLIKQQISYTNKLLSIISPKRESNTYNSYGNYKR